MLSQKLSDCVCNEPLNLKSQSGPKQTASACSCSVCNSVSCFYIRNKKSTQLCSCNHQKVNVECVKSISKETKEFDDKYNLSEIIDYKKSDDDILSDTKCDLQTSKFEKTCEIPKPETSSDKNEQVNPKAELSAQIMNVPYEEFKCSLSKKHIKSDSANNNNSPIYKINELIKPDILTRLKEIYKACSCKVCECITDKSLPITKPLPDKSLPDKEMCNCSPCDCNECVIAQKIKKLDPRPHSGCPCVRCDRKDCRGIVKKPTGVLACDCNPCDCLNCTDASVKSCTCEPCQCAECTMTNRTRTPVLSTTTQKHVTQSTYRCKPCECENCTQIFTTIAANLIQDISQKYSYRYSENDLYFNDLIEFNEDISEYDQNGRRNSIQSNNYDNDKKTPFLSDQLIQTGYNNFNTIAMMAMYSTNYSKVELNNTKDCRCLGCECFICTSREADIKNKISFNDFHHRNVVVTNHSKSCDCVACQCEFCSQAQNKLAHKLVRLKDNCSCSICDCIMCDNIVNSNKKDYIRITSQWVQQEQGLPIQISKDTSCINIYPLKRGKLLAPNKLENYVYEPSCLKSQLYFRNNVFRPHIETRTHLNSNKSSINTLPVYKKSRNFKENENSRYSISNAECPVKDIFSNNYIKNNDLHIDTKSKDFYVPTKLNKALKKEKSLEKHITGLKILDTGTINNNPFNCFDEPKLINIVNVKDSQETSNLISDYSILSIFKSTSDSVIRESISITKDITVLNSNFKRINLSLPDYLDNTRKHYSKQNIIDSTDENKEIIEADRVDLKKDKNKGVKYKYTYNKMYRRLIRQAQMNKRKKTSTNRTKENCISNESNKKVNITENLKIYVDDHNENNLILTIKNKKTVDDFFSSEMNMLNRIKSEVQSIENDVMTKPWPILQKNFCMNCSEIRQNKGVGTIPDLELDFKNTVKFISQQQDNNESKELLQRTQNVIYRHNDATTQTKAMTVQVDKETNCSIIGSTENLRNNMKYLLDLVLSRVVSMSKLNVLSSIFDTMERVSNNIPKINSIDSSCDGLKANIIELKRVSNHSLLVRWKVPQKTAFVHGYELQVDGRSVQRIFSRTRCMAVLTCLPRCEKLLLTIRTLTTTLSDHYPATTVVYRPRNQRKYVPKTKQNVTTLKSKNNMLEDFEVVLPPRSKRNPFISNKGMTNRCCYVSPVCKDVELSTEDSGVYVDDHFNALIRQQYDFDPAIPDAIKNLKALQKVLCGASKVDNSSQYGTAKESYGKTCDGSKWQYVDDPSDIDKYIAKEKATPIIKRKNGENIRINDIPNIKVIAEKFEKYNKNNVELRKLKEKIVCLEYDVFGDNDVAPFQKLRAYFSLKPIDYSATSPKTLPSKIRHNFNITDEDLKKLNENEIEMIDSKITENKSYLDDLKQLLKRKQEFKTKKRQSTLDVRTLYEMAKNDTSIIDKMSTNLLTKDEIRNIKELIMRKSPTSVHGWSKRLVKQEINNDVSQSIIAQLLDE